MKNNEMQIIREVNEILYTVKTSILTYAISADYSKEEVTDIEICDSKKALFIYTNKMTILVTENTLSVDYFKDNGEDFIDTVDHFYNTNIILGLIAPKEEVIAPAMNLQLLAGNEIKEAPIKLTLKNYINHDLHDIKAQDEHAITDLQLCIENDRKFADMIEQVNKNLGLKLKRNDFDENKAIKAYYNIVEAYLLDNYFGYTKVTVTTHDRLILAYNILDDNYYTIEEYSKHLNMTETRVKWNEYKKHLKEVCPEIFKDRIALHQEAIMWLDNLHRNNEISDDIRDNLILK